MVLQDVYLEPLSLLSRPRNLGGRRLRDYVSTSCQFVPIEQQMMLLTSRENRGAACGIPLALEEKYSYVMESRF